MIGPGRVLGLDLGTRRIGVAVTDASQTVATGVTAIVRGRSRADDHRAVADLVTEYGAVGVVVGLPYSLSGQTGPAAQAALAEVEELGAVLPVEVTTMDERFTTVAAATALRAGGRRPRRQRQVIDQSAAAVLLQGWVDRKRDSTIE